MSTAAATGKRHRPALSDKEREKRRAAERQQMTEAIEALRTSEGWQRWLRARRHFHSYSFHNQLLIAHQCPEATRVAGFRAWLALGYCVRKGERAIRIWAPMPPSKKAAGCLAPGGRATRGPAPHLLSPRPRLRPLPGRRAARASKAARRPLEPPHEPISGNGLERLRTPLTNFAAGLGSEVSFEPIPGAAAGYHEPATGRIVIDNAADRSPNAEVQTLVHELAHALIPVERRDR